MNVLNFIKDNYFDIIWLIGAIVSFVVICKYVEPIDLWKHLMNTIKSEKSLINRIFGFIFALFIYIFLIGGYIIMSWFGALVTYFIFEDNDN